MEEAANKPESEDTEEIVLWRSINQEDTDDLWKELCGQMEEEVLEKYKVEEDKKGAYKGRGEPGEWRIVKKEKSYQPRKWSEDFWKGVFSWLTLHSL